MTKAEQQLVAFIKREISAHVAAKKLKCSSMGVYVKAVNFIRKHKIIEHASL